MTDLHPAAGPSAPAQLRARLADTRAQVRACLAPEIAGEPPAVGLGRAACRIMSDSLDAIAIELYGSTPPSARRIALLATGGWGRRETCPYSDIDLLFLTEDEPDDEIRALAERVLYPLWDSGLEVGHSVRSLREALELGSTDVATMTSLLDARALAGDAGLAQELGTQLPQALTRRGDANLFMSWLVREKQSRHNKFGDTLFLLEPNLKHGQGALRDLATGLWAARARWRVRDFAELLPLGQATERQVSTLVAARDFLLRVRCEVHLASRRRHDQLTFELQEAIAPSLYPDAQSPDARPAVAPAVEQLMRRYYLHAKGVVRETDRLLERATVPPHRPPVILKVDASFTSFNGQLSVSDGQIFRDRPAEMFRLFTVALERDQPIYGHTKELCAERALVDAAKIATDPEAHRHFLSLLVSPRDRRQPALLEEMHELGLLNAIMPEFAPCTGRVQHDLYHVYTVDQHQLYAVALLKRIARGELAGESSAPTAAYAELASPLAVTLGTLLHDVGKPLGKGHSEKGARLAIAIGRRLGLSEPQVARVEFLVRHHLLMSHLSQRRDLDDVGMIEKFARVVKDEETLRELYVLTYCDTAMTAPGNLTEWKAMLLKELYERTRAYFRRGPDLAGADRSTIAKRRRARVAELLGEPDPDDDPKGALAGFLAGLPDRYAAVVRPRTMARHVRLARERAAQDVALAVSYHGKKGYSELALVAPDAPGLLSRIAGVLLANRIDIIGAQIHSRAAVVPGDVRLALDVFLVRDRYGKAIKSADPRWARVKEDLTRVVAGTEKIQELIAARRERSGLRKRVTPAVATEIEIDNEVSDDFTVIDVYTHDRLGVLFAITHALTELGLDISLSKVATEAERVADVFYVRKLLAPERLAQVQERVLAALQALPA